MALCTHAVPESQLAGQAVCPFQAAVLGTRKPGRPCSKLWEAAHP